MAWPPRNRGALPLEWATTICESQGAKPLFWAHEPKFLAVGWAVVVDLTYVGAPANIKATIRRSYPHGRARRVLFNGPFPRPSLAGSPSLVRRKAQGCP